MSMSNDATVTQSDISVLREQRRQSQAAYRAQLRDEIVRLEAQRQGLHRTLALLEAQIAEREADMRTLEIACLHLRQMVERSSARATEIEGAATLRGG